MEYVTLIFKNSLLMIKHMIYNSEKLINDLVDSCNQLAKEYKEEHNMRR